MEKSHCSRFNMVVKESRKNNMLHMDIQLEEMELYKN